MQELTTRQQMYANQIRDNVRTGWTVKLSPCNSSCRVARMLWKSGCSVRNCIGCVEYREYIRAKGRMDGAGLGLLTAAVKQENKEVLAFSIKVIGGKLNEKRGINARSGRSRIRSHKKSRRAA